MSENLTIKFQKLNQALLSLRDIYLKPNLPDRSNIDATIQRFEFTFELFWKFLKAYFFEQGIDLNYPKEILQQAFSAKIIDDQQLWLKMLNDRNLTSHTYDQQLADQIFLHIRDYVPALVKTVEKINI